MARMIEHPSAEALAAACAGRLAAALAAALEARGEALFIATGGATAPLIYDRLARAPLDWRRVRIWPSDERAVPRDHPASNARMLRERLLVAAAADAALLGIGADAHVASIFPAGEGMAEARTGAAIALATRPDPLPANAPYARLTLSFACLSAARLVLFALVGAEKRAALASAPADAPAPALIARLGSRAELHWTA